MVVARPQVVQSYSSAPSATQNGPVVFYILVYLLWLLRQAGEQATPVQSIRLMFVCSVMRSSAVGVHLLLDHPALRAVWLLCGPMSWVMVRACWTICSKVTDGCCYTVDTDATFIGDILVVEC